LLVSVGGDSFQALLLLLQRRAAPRPLTLDLLWAVLERAEAVDGEGWSVLRVAVVGMTSTAFVGRLWLGSSATGEVFWDCDIRPSDATWLAVKSNAPIFVHRQVLNNQALGIDRSPPEGGARAEGGAGAPLDPATLMTTPRPLDPEPLKRLKMELRVALAEEDYAAAARIRDHPFCKLHWAAATARAVSRAGDGGGWGGGGGQHFFPLFRLMALTACAVGLAACARAGGRRGGCAAV
jgi:bifunctional DNase/RNase